MEVPGRFKTDSMKTAALLGLFAAGLLFARVLVGYRSAIRLSGPIDLAGTGLSVQMPSGEGWRSLGQWERNRQGFVLRSFFYPSAGAPSLTVSCSYLAGAASEGFEQRFRQRALEVGGRVVRDGSFEAGAARFDWVRIVSDKGMFEVLTGFAALEDGSLFNVEVYVRSGEGEFAHDLFEAVASSITASPPPAPSGRKTVAARGWPRFLFFSCGV